MLFRLQQKVNFLYNFFERSKIKMNTPIKCSIKNPEQNPNFVTPLKIPQTPFLEKLGYGTGKNYKFYEQKILNNVGYREIRKIL